MTADTASLWLSFFCFPCSATGVKHHAIAALAAASVACAASTHQRKAQHGIGKVIAGVLIPTAATAITLEACNNGTTCDGAAAAPAAVAGAVGLALLLAGTANVAAADAEQTLESRISRLESLYPTATSSASADGAPDRDP